jgi:hypothetical protein
VSGPRYLTTRRWELGDGLALDIGIPCNAHGAVTLSPEHVATLREYVELLEREAEIATRRRGTPAASEPDAAPSPTEPAKGGGE